MEHSTVRIPRKDGGSLGGLKGLAALRKLESEQLNGFLSFLELRV